ncbi:MAG: hypothetical protein JNM89_10480 [Hyphomicrobiaceae bacterium]|nr:hypothetical protein [Hyphomicrobiaceae bacterium]
MTSGPTIDYDALQQDAMRGLVRSVLTEVAKSGLPGDHHFYISFNTRAPGVGLSRRLKEKYPREMTIVLQHRFWGLTVSDDRFEVNLTFDGIPERLVIPFQAILVFFDPSVRFGHQFDSADIGPDPRIPSPLTAETPLDEPVPGPRVATSTTTAKPAAQRKPRQQKKVRNAEAEKETASAGAATEPAAPAAPAVSGPALVTSQPDAPAEGASKVVSLDQFRKR